MGMAREASAERRHRARGGEVDGRRARETGNRIEAAVSRPQSIFFTAFLDYDFFARRIAAAASAAWTWCLLLPAAHGVIDDWFLVG